MINKFNVLLLIVLRSRKNYKAAKQLFIMRYIIITLYSISFFLWIIRKIYYVHDDTEAFFLLLWQLNFDVFVGTFFAFCYFLLKNDFDIFHVLLSPAFLCVLDDSYFPFLWIEKKIIINLSFFLYASKINFVV